MSARSLDLNLRDTVLCAGTIQGVTFIERLTAARAGGFNAISLFATDYQQAREQEKLSDADMRSMLADHGLCIAELDSLMNWIPGFGVDGFGASETEFYRMADALGARSLNVVFAFPFAVPPESVVPAFAAVCDRAAEHGLRVHLESLPWTQIGSVALAAEVVAAANRANGGLMLDTWHHFRSGAANDVIAAAGARILAVQVSDAPRQAAPDLISETLNDRRLPGDGDIDLVDIIRRLDAAGSQAPMGVEVFSTELAKLDPEEIGRRCGARLRDVIGKARS